MSVSFMATLWKGLPPEILENVLACLPVHVLCRFRLVCKRWNHLISQPRFASLYAQAPRQASYVLVTPKTLEFKTFRTEKRRDWEIFDVAERRFYSLSDSFIADNLSCSKKFEFGCIKTTLAADGGLIYALYKPSYDPEEQHRCHIVCNPVSKDFHQIAEPEPHWTGNNDIVVMSVDNASKSYRILIMESFNSTRSRRERAYLYSSTTMQWRELCEVPEGNLRACSSIFMQGTFYTLFVDLAVAPRCRKLYSCDTETGAWSYIDVELPRPSGSRCDRLQLVLCSGRLFYVEYSGFPATILPIGEIVVTKKQGNIKLPITVSVWEVLLARKEIVKVAKTSKDLKFSRRALNERRHSMVGNVVAVGCGDSIVISSWAYRVEFDLSENCWRELPGNNEHMHGTIARRGICAGLVHLDLREMHH